MMRALLASMPALLAAMPTAEEQARLKQADPNAGVMLQLYSIFHNFDWKWLLLFAIAATMIFGTIVFSMMLMRRWHSPKLGFFLITITIGIIRTFKPEQKAWLVPAGAGVALAISLLVGYFAKKQDWRRSNLKEPIYYLLNAFALCMFIMPFNEFGYTAAAAAVFASLFFLVSVAPKPKNKYKKRDADPAILDSLEKRVNKNRGKM